MYSSIADVEFEFEVVRKSMKRIVYDRIHNKTHGGEAREQSLRPNRPEEDGLGRGPAPDVGVMSSWTDGPRDQGPDGSDCASGGQRSTLGNSNHTVPNQHHIESIMLTSGQDAGEEELAVRGLEGVGDLLEVLPLVVADEFPESLERPLPLLLLAQHHGQHLLRLLAPLPRAEERAALGQELQWGGEMAFISVPNWIDRKY